MQRENVIDQVTNNQEAQVLEQIGGLSRAEIKEKYGSQAAKKVIMALTIITGCLTGCSAMLPSVPESRPSTGRMGQQEYEDSMRYNWSAQEAARAKAAEAEAQRRRAEAAVGEARAVQAGMEAVRNAIKILQDLNVLKGK